jgi:acyl-CoA thioesterase
MNAPEEPRLAGPCSVADGFCTLLGIRIASQRVGKAIVEMTAAERHCNDLGIVHGGALFSLADAALAVASNAREGDRAVAANAREGDRAVAATLTIHYSAPARIGDVLVAEAVEEHRGERLGGYGVRVTRGSELIATALGTTVLVGRRDASRAAPAR